MSKHLALTLVLISLTAFSLFIIPVESQTMGVWISKAAMPTARSSLGLAATNNSIFAIGGFLGINVDTVEKYDLATDTWVTKTPMPVANRGFEVTVCQNNIYTIGGDMGNIEVYFPSNDSWIVKEWSARRYGFGVSTVHDKIYIIGGGRSWLYPEYGYSLYNYTDVYDPATDSWTTAAPIPTPILDCLSVEADNKIYIISDNLIQIYSPENDTWLSSITTNLAISGYNSGTTKVASTKSPDGTSKIHLINQTAHQTYCPKTNQWSTAPPMLTYRNIFALTSYGNSIFSVGGLHADGWAGRENEMYTQENTEPTSLLSPTSSPSASFTTTPSSTISPTINLTSSPSPASSPTATATPSPASPEASSYPTLTLPPSPTIPEFHVWIILPILGVLAVCAMVLRKRMMAK